MLIPIGQFSKMSRLSIKALRLYADNGLLVPAHIDQETGYRYYNPAQAKRAEIVRILRSVDMPLDEIHAIVDAAGTEAADDLLFAHRQRLSERLSTQERMLSYLESIIQNKERIMPYNIRIAQVEPVLIAGLRTRTSLKSIPAAISSGFGQLMQGMMQQQCPPAGPPMVLYHDVIDEDTEGDIELCVPVTAALKSEGKLASRELPGGEVATVTHHGPYEELSSAYHAAFAWIAEQGYELAGSPRETYLNDPREVKPEALVTQLDFPVSRQSVV